MNFYNRQDNCMAIVNGFQTKGLFVYTSKGFTLRCRIKIHHQPFPYQCTAIFNKW